MKTYKVIGAYASFMSGVLRLTEEQYEARRHALHPVGGDLYQVVQPTGFKQGEILGYEGEVNKTLLQDITPIEAEIAEIKEENSIKGILELSSGEIKDLLMAMTDVDLAALSQAEAEGKNRKGVLKAVEDEIAARKHVDVDSIE